MKFECPNCKKPVFNRRLKNCEFCQSVIPSALLYSSEEIETLNQKNTTKISIPKIKLECPECKKPIFNRRLKKCEFCYYPLPKEFAYSQTDLEILKQKNNGKILLSTKSDEDRSELYENTLDIIVFCAEVL